MDPKTALQNLSNVVEAFVGNAEQHRLLALSLQIVKQRMERADELEKAAADTAANEPTPPPATN